MPPKLQQKRRREGGGRGGGDRGRGGGTTPPPTPPPPSTTAASPAPVLKRRCRSFDLEIRGCSCRHHQGLPASCGCAQAVEAAIGRLKAELTEVLTSLYNHPPGPRATIGQNLLPTYKLSFLNSLSDEIFTKREVRAAGGDRIKIRMVVSNQQGCRNLPHLLASANVKIVVLDGDFNANDCGGWTTEEFNDHIVRPRDKVGAVLTGKVDVKLENGEAYLHDVTFIDNSSFTRSRKFRLGVKLIGDVGEQVQGGITEPFTVKDRRGERYKKRKIPMMDDEVCCLKKISMGGVFHEALKQSKIFLVKHFLRLYYKDAKALRNILSNASQSFYTTMVDHAKKCDPGSALYSHFVEDKKIWLYFSSLGQIVGATIADQYNAFGDLDTPWKVQVEELCKDAYECMTYDKHDYEMYDGQPRSTNCSTVHGSITPGTKSTEPNDQIMHEADEHDTSKGNEFSANHSSQHCTFKRLGSVRVRTLPSAHKNNEADVPFEIDVQLDSGPEIQYETLDANYNIGSVTLHCPTAAADEIIASAALDQAALAMNQEDYHQMSFTNDGSSLGHWYPEEQVISQYASSSSLSYQADFPILSAQNSFAINQLFEDLPGTYNPQFFAPIVSELPTDVRCSMTKMPSYSRWVKLTALVKWKAKLRASKRARLMLEQEG